MARFVLPIKSSYVPAWGSWETIREVLQNAKDEEDANGNEMDVRHQNGWLCITNRGANMTKEALLLGHTTKADRGDLRGQYGEGLDLALLAGVRAGLEIVIKTPSEIWRPSLSKEEQFGGHEVLVITTRKRRKRGDGVQVQIKIPKKDWLDSKKLFLFLTPPKDSERVVTSKGTVLLSDKRRGQIFVKGIFVDKRTELRYGYDLPDAELDRDRRMVNVWDLLWRLGKVYNEAAAKEPELLGPKLYLMLKEGADDTKHVGDNFILQDGVSEQMAAQFQNDHGTDVLPVESMAESVALDHYGKRGVVVNDSLRAVLQRSMGTIDDIKMQLAYSVVDTYAWSDLSTTEKRVLTSACDRIEHAAATLGYKGMKLLTQLEIVDFNDENLHGTADLAGGRIRLARKILETEAQTVMTLIHEEAHTMAKADDGTKIHIQLVEELWTAVFAASIGEQTDQTQGDKSGAT